jgi:antitoxin (DNA-binding transcriptional repressor) of toxin-antitoxin stability system
METVTVIDLQGNPLVFLERVQAGERLLVVHQNRPIAELRPVEAAAGEVAPDGELAETYRAQFEAALAAGWDDPAMNDYDNYDAHRSL